MVVLHVDLGYEVLDDDRVYARAETTLVLSSIKEDLALSVHIEQESAS